MRNDRGAMTAKLGRSQDDQDNSAPDQNTAEQIDKPIVERQTHWEMPRLQPCQHRKAQQPHRRDVDFSHVWQSFLSGRNKVSLLPDDLPLFAGNSKITVGRSRAIDAGPDMAAERVFDDGQPLLDQIAILHQQLPTQ